MGHFENIVKIEEIRKRMDDGDFLSAQKILDTMDLRKIKNSTDMSLVAEVFAQNARYEDAIEIFIKIYQKTGTRKTLYQLIDCYIKDNNADEAQKYLLEYEKIAPLDFYKYILRYRIDKLKGENFEKLIEILETLKKSEYIEQWAYELAKLYYKAGMEKECIDECSDIILWFGEGVFVEKAKMLKAYYSGETDKDKIIEELKRRAAQNRSVEDQKVSESKENSVDDTYIDEDAEEFSYEDKTFDEETSEEDAPEEKTKKKATKENLKGKASEKKLQGNTSGRNKLQKETIQDKALQEETTEKDELIDFTADLKKDIERIFEEQENLLQ
jgi:hypothetical protein